MILNNFQFQLMNNPYEDWDEYDWQDHISKVSHQDFLKTEKGRQWQREKQKEKRNESLKYFILIVIAVIVLLLIIRAGGCNINSSNEPYRR